MDPASATVDDLHSDSDNETKVDCIYKAIGDLQSDIDELRKILDEVRASVNWLVSRVEHNGDF